MSHSELAILFFFQFALILVTIKIVGAAARKIGQPQVVGEMLAGVLLGPTFFGKILPEIQAAVFPPDSIPIIFTISQLGLVLYMFLIGAEFDVDMIRRRKRHAAMVSIAGILTPFILGGIAALYMVRDPHLFNPEVKPHEAFLFIGAAMSITAFPMLARIIQERGLARTAMGTLALAAGSLDDAAAWCILALVVASFGGEASIAISAIGGGILYGAFVLGIIRPLLQRFLAPVVDRHGSLSGGVLTFILLLLMLAAWFTDIVGIYAVFGAFIMGVAMPRGLVAEELHRKIHPLAANFFLPLFFIFSGLRTELGLLANPYFLGVSLIILVIAILGKGVACWAAARLSGENNRDAIIIGTFMNARGLMELILLNIGVEHGIVTPTLFAVMVVMTVVTTMMVGPILEVVMRRSPDLASLQLSVVAAED